MAKTSKAKKWARRWRKALKIKDEREVRKLQSTGGGRGLVATVATSGDAEFRINGQVETISAKDALTLAQFLLTFFQESEDDSEEDADIDLPIGV